jgi:hypothetical protein
MCLIAFLSLRRKQQDQTANQNDPPFFDETLD